MKTEDSVTIPSRERKYFSKVGVQRFCLPFHSTSELLLSFQNVTLSLR